MATYSPSPCINDFLENDSSRLQAFPITDTAVDRELSTFEDEPPLDYIQPISTQKTPSTDLHQIPQPSPSNPSRTPVYDVSPTALHAYEKGFADVSVESEGPPDAPPPTPQAVADHVAKGGACASRQEAEANMRNAARREVVDARKVRDMLKMIDLTLTAVEMRMANDRILSGLLSKLGRDAAEMALTSFYMGRSDEHRGLMTGRSFVEERLAQEVRRLYDAVSMDHIRGNVLVTGHSPDLMQRMEDVEIESARLRKKELEAVEKELKLVELELAKEGGKGLEPMLNATKEWCLKLKNQHMEEQKKKELERLELQRREHLREVNAVVALSHGHRRSEQSGGRTREPQHTDVGAVRTQSLSERPQPAASTYMYHPARKVPVPSMISAAMHTSEGRFAPVPSQSMYLETPRSHAMQQEPAHVGRQQHLPATSDVAIPAPQKFYLADAVNAALRQQPIPVAQLNHEYGPKAQSGSGPKLHHVPVTGPIPYQTTLPAHARPEYGAQPPHSTHWCHKVNANQPNMQIQYAPAPTQPNYFPHGENTPTHPYAAPFMQNYAPYAPPSEYGNGRPHSLSHNPGTVMPFPGTNQMAQYVQMPGHGPTLHPHGTPPHRVLYDQYPERPYSYPEGTYADSVVLPSTHPGFPQRPSTTVPLSYLAQPYGYPRFEGDNALSNRLSEARQAHRLPHGHSRVTYEGAHPPEPANAGQTASGHKMPSHFYKTNQGTSTLLETGNERFLLRLEKISGEVPQGAVGRTIGQTAANPVGEQNLVPYSNAQLTEPEISTPIPQREVSGYYQLHGKQLENYAEETFRQRETVVTRTNAQLSADMMLQETHSYEEYRKNLKEVARPEAQRIDAGHRNGPAHQIGTDHRRQRTNAVSLTESDIVTGAIPVESIPLFPEMREIRGKAEVAHAPRASGGGDTISEVSGHILGREPGGRSAMPNMLHGAPQEALRAGESTSADQQARRLQSMMNAFANM